RTDVAMAPNARSAARIRGAESPTRLSSRGARENATMARWNSLRKPFALLRANPTMMRSCSIPRAGRPKRNMPERHFLDPVAKAPEFAFGKRSGTESALLKYRNAHSRHGDDRPSGRADGAWHSHRTRTI